MAIALKSLCSINSPAHWLSSLTYVLPSNPSHFTEYILLLVLVCLGVASLQVQGHIMFSEYVLSFFIHTTVYSGDHVLFSWSLQTLLIFPMHLGLGIFTELSFWKGPARRLFLVNLHPLFINAMVLVSTLYDIRLSTLVGYMVVGGPC